MAYTPVQLEKNGTQRVAKSYGEEARLRWDGWLPTGTPVTVDTFDDRVRDLVEDKTSVTAKALGAAFGSQAPTRYDSTKLRAFRAALGARATTPVDILFGPGDSVTEGRGASVTANRWTSRAREGLRARLQPAGVTGGEGYVPAFYVSVDRTDRLVATSGTLTQREDLYGLGVRSSGLGTSVSTFTFTGTGCDILYAETTSAGSFSWSIDGAAATTVTSGGKGAIRGGRPIPIRGLTAGSHTITLTGLTGNGGYVEGFMVYNGDESAGVRTWESGHSGWTANHYDTNQYWWETLATVQPDLIVLFLGLNDYGNGTLNIRATPAAYKASLQSVLVKMRAKITTPPSVLLVLPYERGQVVNPLAPWSEYRQALLDLAAADSAITLLDLEQVMGPFTSDPYGVMFGNDGAHPNDKGHQMIADAVVDLLTRPAA